MNFHLADYYFKTGDEPKAFEWLAMALETASEKEYISQFENKVFDYHDLLFFGIKKLNRKHRSFLKNIFERVLGMAQTQWFSSDAKKRLTQQSENFYDISMSSFGSLEFKVRAEAVAENVWKRKISKLILAYLVLHEGDKMKINKDMAVDKFFGEMPMDKAEPLLHNAITNIRNALKTSGRDTQYLIYENKLLSLDPDYYYKSDAARFNRLYELIKSGETDTSKKKEYISEAKELYKGEFLPGFDYTWCNEMREEFRIKYDEIVRL